MVAPIEFPSEDYALQKYVPYPAPENNCRKKKIESIKHKLDDRFQHIDLQSSNERIKVP